jgi:TonB family protein
MQQPNPVKRVASSMVAALAICFWFVIPARSDVDKDRKSAAKNLSKEIEQAHFQRVYVSDFLDVSGTRTEKGCYFASSFSTNLAKNAGKFAVVNRIRAQKQLADLHISAHDLQQSEVLSKAVATLGADAILVGSATISAKNAELSLSLRDTSGKEVHSLNYQEKLQPGFESSFPATEDANIHAYYFPGLDDVSLPKCIYCPDPEFSDEARRNKMEGSVVVSVRIDEHGTIREVRVVQDPGYGLARQAVNILSRWRLNPSKDPDGNPIPVRATLEVTFRLLRPY